MFFELYNLDYNDYINYEEKEKSDYNYKILGNNKKLKSLGWEPKYSFDTRIRQVVEWTLNNKQWL
jgi:dTDP-glucose 4,6-dehydratase